MSDLATVFFELNNPPCIAETIENDVVIINLDSGNYYNISGLAGEVWGFLAAGYSINDMLKSIPVLEGHLQDFVAKLLSEDMLRPRKSNEKDSELLPLVRDLSEINLDFKVYTDMQELLGLDPIHESDEIMGWPKAEEVSS